MTPPFYDLSILGCSAMIITNILATTGPKVLGDLSGCPTKSYTVSDLWISNHGQVGSPVKNESSWILRCAMAVDMLGATNSRGSEMDMWEGMGTVCP